MDIVGCFDKYEHQAYPYKFHGEMIVHRIVGGTPSDPKVAEGWIKSKVTATDDAIRSSVAEIMAERGLEATEAVEELARRKTLVGFKRDEVTKELYVEGRQLKAGIKEAGNIRWPKRKWGPTNKGTQGFFSEHVFIAEHRLYLGVTEPSDIVQSFVHTWRGSSVQYNEVVDNAKLSFTLETDWDFAEEDWGLLWVTAQKEAIGAARSQGNGRFKLVSFEPITPEAVKPKRTRTTK
jgi:hypothetical protein